MFCPRHSRQRDSSVSWNHFPNTKAGSHLRTGHCTSCSQTSPRPHAALAQRDPQDLRCISLCFASKQQGHRTGTNSPLLILHRLPRSTKAHAPSNTMAASGSSGNASAKPSRRQLAWSPADASALQGYAATQSQHCLLAS